MKTIKILWTGCVNCKKLESNVKAVLEELWTDAKVEKIEDIVDIMSYGVMWTPALVIDNKVVSVGRVLSVDELKNILSWDFNKENS